MRIPQDESLPSRSPLSARRCGGRDVDVASCVDSDPGLNRSSLYLKGTERRRLFRIAQRVCCIGPTIAAPRLSRGRVVRPPAATRMVTRRATSSRAPLTRREGPTRFGQALRSSSLEVAVSITADAVIRHVCHPRHPARLKPTYGSRSLLRQSTIPSKKVRTTVALDGWMDRAQTTGIRSLRNFVERLRRDVRGVNDFCRCGQLFLPAKG
jgi:hypothetical protein